MRDPIDPFAGYPLIEDTWDELIGPDGRPRPEFASYVDALRRASPEELAKQRRYADIALLNQGITFSVYSDARGTEKVFPFCTIPRMIGADDWTRLERGLEQRVRALEAFVRDLYDGAEGSSKLLSDAAVDPIIKETILGSKLYERRLCGHAPAGRVRIHVSGIDLIRDPAGTYRVLEDNLRCPSGVSYVLENRVLTKRVVPEIFRHARVAPVETYPAKLMEALRACAPDAASDPTVMVLTPGPYNSAYFEHSFLARTMGVELVEAPDLFVEDARVYVRTIHGPQRVDVLYRRTDDAYLDPRFFRPDSMLGVPGIMEAWTRGNVTLANAPGNGVADDKGVYPFVPDLVRYYLGEAAILDQVPTYLCARPEDRAYVLDHLQELVVKAVDEAGGYGMLMGPQATSAEIAEFRGRITADPRRYIAQPRIELSTTPTFIPSEDGETGTLEARRVDLRPYIIQGPDGPWVLRGGLTRTALIRGSYVVNSSQGGGSKDTWVLE